MGLVDTDAIVLRTYKLAEADKIVILLTQQAGLIRGVARGARRLKSRFGASLEPLTLVAISYFEKEGRELVSLRQAEILRSYFGLAKETETVAVLEYLAGLVLEFAPPHEPNEKLFRMVKACVEAIAGEPERLPALARYFELWTLRLSGFLPNLRACTGCNRQFAAGEEAYIGAESALRCVRCTGGKGTPLSVASHRQMRAIQQYGPAEWAARYGELPRLAQTEVAQITQGLIARVLERAPRGRATLMLVDGETASAPRTAEVGRGSGRSASLK